MANTDIGRTRTFNYVQPNGIIGVRLLSETHPETGTTSYAYNADGTLASKTDAKGQVLGYVYDGYKRVTSFTVNGYAVRNYTYDADAPDSPYIGSGKGRLTKVDHLQGQGSVRFQEFYSYT